MKTLIIPDIHGKADLLSEMLAEHASTSDRIIQLGDLANCVYGSQDGDVACLKLAKEFDIELLVGNHEHPYFGGPGFSGFASIPEVKETVYAGSYKAAALVGDVVVTHAGIRPTMFAEPEPAHIVSHINRVWRHNPMAAIFSAIGYKRGGYSEHGGILWRDIKEPIDTSFKQIFGHSNGSNFRYGNTWVCIDSEQPYIAEN